MSTMKDLIDATRSQTSQTLNDQFNLLAVDYVPVAGAATATLSFSYNTDNMSPGMLLSAGLQSFYILDVAPLTRQAVVFPSPNGEPDGLVEAGSRVRVRPRYTDWMIFQLLNNQIVEMSSSLSGLYGVMEWTAQAVTHTDMYPIDPQISAELTDLAAVYLSPPGLEEMINWRYYALHRGEFAMAVRIFDQNRLSTGGLFTFIGKRTFAPALTINDDPVVDCGLAETMLDIPVLGASAALMWGGESRRVQLEAQGDSRRPDEVPATSNSSSAREWQRTRDLRVRTEYARLIQAYPPTRGRW
jgi:hypothetical protein